MIVKALELDASEPDGFEASRRLSASSRPLAPNLPLPWVRRGYDVEMALCIPKLRKGPYWLSSREPRRKADKALTVVMQDAYIQGVTTRSVDELVQAEVPGLKAIMMNFLGSKVIMVRVRSSQGDRLRHLDVVPRPFNKSTTAYPWGQSAATHQL